MFGKGFYFIAFCMTLIAASAGAVLHYAAGITAVEAAFGALALLFGLLTVEAVSARVRDRQEVPNALKGSPVPLPISPARSVTCISGSIKSKPRLHRI